MVYRPRPGIVLLNICGVQVLAATRATWEDCKQIRPVPNLCGACWTLMDRGKTSEEAMRYLIDKFHFAEEKVRQKLVPLLDVLCEEGFLIPAEEES